MGGGASLASFGWHSVESFFLVQHAKLGKASSPYLWRAFDGDMQITGRAFMVHVIICSSIGGALHVHFQCASWFLLPQYWWCRGGILVGIRVIERVTFGLLTLASHELQCGRKIGIWLVLTPLHSLLYSGKSPVG